MKKEGVVSVLILYLALSLFLFFRIPHPSMRLEADSGAYVQNTGLLAESSSETQYVRQRCGAWVAPGYSLFIAGVQAVTSRIPFLATLHVYDRIALTQIFLGLMLIMVLFSLAKLLLSPSVAFWAAVLGTLTSGFIIYPQFILADILHSFVVLVAFERFCRYLCKHNLKTLIVSGALWGISIWIKASAWYFIPILSVVLLFFYASSEGIHFSKTLQFFQTPRVRGVHIPLFFLIAFTVPVVSLGFYNQKAYGHFFIKAVDKVNLYTYFLPKVIAQVHHVPLPYARLEVNRTLEVTEYASGKGWHNANKLLWKYVTHNPLNACWVAMINILKTMGGLYTNHLKLLFTYHRRQEGVSFFHFSGSWWHKLKAYIAENSSSHWMITLGALEVLWQMMRYFLLCFGIFFLCLQRRWASIFLFGSFIIYFIIITFPDGCARLRLVSEAPLLILAAYGLVEIKKQVRNVV